VGAGVGEGEGKGAVWQSVCATAHLCLRVVLCYSLQPTGCHICGWLDETRG
jgi:hypothetical protein